MRKEHTDPFAAQFSKAGIDDWVYYPKTKICGLVIALDDKTGFMKIHCFKTMQKRWLQVQNFGQYKVL